jgi:hypothetical protein
VLLQAYYVLSTDQFILFSKMLNIPGSFLSTNLLFTAPLLDVQSF